MSKPTWARFIARSMNGEWFYFENRPLLNDNKWTCVGQHAPAPGQMLDNVAWFSSCREIAPSVSPTVAPDFLNFAAKHMADRAATYDQPEGERSMGKAVQAFNAFTGRELTESEGWLLMQCVKNVRLFQRPGFHRDSAEDAIAYGALVAEAKQKEVA